jgi:hypothetical protein
MSRWVRVTRRCFGCGAIAEWSGRPSQVEVEIARWAASHAAACWARTEVPAQLPGRDLDPRVLPPPRGGAPPGPAPLPEGADD